MTNEKIKQCKKKGCNNPVLDGKYCEHCKQKRKEKKDKILLGAGGVVILGAGGILNREAIKGAIKQVPKFSAEVIQVILKK